MKKYYKLTWILLFWLSLLNAQTNEIFVNNATKASYDLLMQKKRTNNTVGWILVSTGPALIIGGIAINLSGGFTNEDGTNNSKGLWLSYVGGATTIASIPFFIAAGSNKRKAKLLVKQDVVLVPLDKSATRQIALSLSVDLN